MIRKLLQERARGRALTSLDAIETPVSRPFDYVVDQAATAFAAPIALLTLIRDEHTWVKASVGIAVNCMPREDSFCNHAIDRADLLEVCDAAADERFRSLPPVVQAPFARYYIGAPLTLADGTDIGVLCVLDTRPRPPASADQRAYLIALARQAVVAIERPRLQAW